MKRSSCGGVSLAVLLLLSGSMAALAGEVVYVPAQAVVPADWFEESTEVPTGPVMVAPPSFEGKVVVRDGRGGWREIIRPGLHGPQAETVQPDIFVEDGSETALAINIADSNNLVTTLNLGFTNSQSMFTSSNGNLSWTARLFPNGGGLYDGFPFDPWANAGTSANELFATLIRRGTGGQSGNAHVVIARSTDSGVSWSLFFEKLKDVFQDRSMVDIDRTNVLGGGTGNTHDGKVYLTYDDFGSLGSGYAGSFVQVVSSTGAALTELTVSTNFSFVGSKLTPAAGVNDGQVFLMGTVFFGGGASRTMNFHEITNAATLTVNKSTISYTPTGQRLGSSSRWGLSGHRINVPHQMDVDRTNGPRRGHIFVISDRNQNPTDPTQDQGDVFLSVSTDGAASWTSTVVPSAAANKTQFFTMLDVDDNGWIHVAYYQNEFGIVDNGVLNASRANLYYTVSPDGGNTWSLAEKINDAGNVLDYFNPPLDLADLSYYLIGDYAQIQATGTGVNTKAYVCWTGYDKDRSDMFLDDKRQREICTTIIPMVPLTPSGEVPDDDVNGTPLTLDKAGGGLINLFWGSSCLGSDVDYGIYEGSIASLQTGVYDHGFIACTDAAPTLQETISPMANSAYYLVVPQSADREGAYGNDSGGTERGPAVTSCLPQEIGSCP